MGKGPIYDRVELLGKLNWGATPAVWGLMGLLPRIPIQTYLSHGRGGPVPQDDATPEA